MIHWKKKDFDNPPAKLLTEKCSIQIKKAVDKKDGEEYTTTYYQNDEVLNKLRAFSIDKDVFDKDSDEAKCYYCESFTETVATLQVEHYRPKAKTCDENNKTVDGTKGYYWLGCEWSNLLLACPKCNGSGAKGNKFPIKGTRVIDENPIKGTDTKPVFDRSNCNADDSPLIDEDPFLLNPEVDEIVSRFTFSSDGEIKGVDDKGKMSAKIYKLDRSQLNIARNKIKQYLFSHINVTIEACDEGLIDENIAISFFVKNCKMILTANDKRKAYTLWARFFNEHFEECFVSEVPDKYKNPLRSAYRIASQQ